MRFIVFLLICFCVFKLGIAAYTQFTISYFGPEVHNVVKKYKREFDLEIRSKLVCDYLESGKFKIDIDKASYEDKIKYTEKVYWLIRDIHNIYYNREILKTYHIGGTEYIPKIIIMYTDTFIDKYVFIDEMIEKEHYFDETSRMNSKKCEKARWNKPITK